MYKKNSSLSAENQAISNQAEITKFIFSKTKTDLEFILIGCDGIWEGCKDNGKNVVEYVAE